MTAFEELLAAAPMARSLMARATGDGNWIVAMRLTGPDQGYGPQVKSITAVTTAESLGRLISEFDPDGSIRKSIKRPPGRYPVDVVLYR